MSAARTIQFVMLVVGALALAQALIVWRRGQVFPSGLFALASMLMGGSTMIGLLG